MNNFFDCIVRATKVNGMIEANIVEVFNLLDFVIVYNDSSCKNFSQISYSAIWRILCQMKKYSLFFHQHALWSVTALKNGKRVFLTHF